MIHVVSCFVIRNDKKILLLKRSDKVSTYQGRWATVSGYIEAGEKDDETAFKEIREELGLNTNEIELIKKGSLVYADGKWIVHPYLFRLRSDEIKLNLDWEHVRYRWIEPEELNNYDTVPKLKEALENVLDNDI